MNFLVKYTVTTHSTAGAYVYHSKKEVEAETEQAACDYVKKNAGSWFGFKRCSVSIRSINPT